MHIDSIEEYLSEEAIEWFTKLHSGHCTSDDRRNFEIWRQLSAQHVEAYADVEKMWILLEKPAKNVFEKEQIQPLAKTISTSSIRKTINRLSKRPTVVSLSLAAAIIMFTWLPDTFLFWTSDYHTHWGERRELTLADGSQVTLNTHTALSVEFSEQQRVIKLKEGEAFFKVTHNPACPFIVMTEHGNAKVRGTSFDVYKQDKQMTVTVTTGRVNVFREGKEDQAIELTAGMQASQNNSDTGPVVYVNTQQTSAWKDGQLVFTQKPLAAVVDELNRYFPGKIIIVDPGIRQRTVSGAFDLTNSKDIFIALEKNLKLRSVSVSEALVLLY